MRCKPVTLPDDDAALYASLGVPKSMQGFAFLSGIRPAWAAHSESWAAVDGAMTPRDTYKYYLGLGKTPVTRSLSALGLHHLLRPLSAASCERVFSYLSQMDTTNRRSMGKKLVSQLLYLRSNHHIIRELVANFAMAKRAARLAEDAGGKKRRFDTFKGAAAEAVRGAKMPREA
jgi:hypothetical protein